MNYMVSNNRLNLKNTKETIVYFLNSISLFDELTKEELATVVDYMNLFKFEKGQTLFEEGANGDYVCFVADGAIDVVKKSVTGSNVVISTLGKGSVIGEMAVIDNIPRSATVRARKTTQLVILGQKGFKLILDKEPKIGNKILIGIARRLSSNLRRTSNQLNAFNHLLMTINKQTGQKMPENIEQYTTPESQDAVQEKKADEEGAPSGFTGMLEKAKKGIFVKSSRRIK